MDLQIIRDGVGRVIGKISIMPNGDKQIMDKNGKLPGRYIKAMNRTQDATGNLVARCDCPMILLNP